MIRLQAKLLLYYVKSKGGTARMCKESLSRLFDVTEPELPSLLENLKRHIEVCVFEIELRNNKYIINVVNAEKDDGISIIRVFDYWKRKFKKTKQTKLTKQRREKISARLREGYSITDLFLAIDGIAVSTFHIENHFTDVTHVCKSSVTVDRFLAIANQQATPKQPSFRDRMRKATQ